MKYKPEPIKTEDVTLSQSLISLQEQLAQNSHDHWATARFSEGWSLGAERDDRKKTHPCLVPYSDLPEAEKDYDRRSAVETIKAILKLGYEIKAPVSESTVHLAATAFQVPDVLKSMERASSCLASLYDIWNERELVLWLSVPMLHQKLAERACRLGEPFFALDICNDGLKAFKEDRRLLQLRAWALAQTGATESALQILENLPIADAGDIDTAGLLGRCYKDLGRMEPTTKKRKLFFRESAEIYRRGFEAVGASYLALNAATLLFLIGEEEDSRALALRARSVCLAEMESNLGDPWHHATLAEIALLMDDPSAHEKYKEFRTAAGSNHAMVYSARKQAHLILVHKGYPANALDHILRVPSIAVFAGHMIDLPGRSTPRFQPTDEGRVKEVIEAMVERMDVGVSFSSAACGGDILFLEAMLKKGREFHLVLPCPVDVFRNRSVVQVAGSQWGSRFDELVDKATSLTIANSQDRTLNPTSIIFCNQLTYGMAKNRSETIGGALECVALWNELPGDGTGGTAESVEMWRQRGESVVVVNPFPKEVYDVTLAVRPIVSNSEIRAMLFADIVGYSQLTEQDIPLYEKHFLSVLGAIVDKSKYQPITRNTWGDAIYFVFKNVKEAGLMALQIKEFVCVPGKWQELGFSKELNIRIGLHAGPVYSMTDSITGNPTYCGTHVNRAARIEPITEEGQIFTSEEFAALVRAEDVREFRCDYVGQMDLPKKSGRIRAHILTSVQ